MTILFKCKTADGYSFKGLAELLNNNMNIANFVIDKNSIKLRCFDNRQYKIFDLDLSAENFSIFTYNHTEPQLFMGLTMSHTHRMLKSIKKKDSIVLKILKEKPTELVIQVIPQENNRRTTSVIKILKTQNINIELPGGGDDERSSVYNGGYDKPVLVPSIEFQKVCKDLNSISSTTRVSSKRFLMRFGGDAGGIYSRNVDFGEPDDSDDETLDDMDPENKFDYEEIFNTEDLFRISKISTICEIIKVYSHKKLPLFFKCNVGRLGTMSVYLRSKNSIDNDNEEESSEDEF